MTSGWLRYEYTYDSMGNIATYAAPGKGTVTYTYDNQGQLLSAAGDTTYTYTYDGAGNILTASDGTTTHSYTYGDTDWKDLLTGFDGQAIIYDAIGNPTSYYNGTRWAMTWENGRSLATASDGTNSLSFTYDASGMRTSKTVNGTTYRYYYASGKLMRMSWGANIVDFFYDESGLPYAMKYNGTAYYYITNLQGDVMRIVDGSQNTVTSYDYDPYGKVISATGTLANINPLRYRGYVYDQETGFYYLQSRYYDPATGRFFNADSYASTGQGIIGYDMFAYCGSNPILSCDTSGNRMVSCLDTDFFGYTQNRETTDTPTVDITKKLTSAMVENSVELTFYKEHYGLLAAVLHFYQNVKPGGAWDFKSQEEWDLNNNASYLFNGTILRYDDIGNIHYGFVGRVIFSEETLLLAGGVVQIRTGTSKWSYWKSNFDDPRDQWAIQIGCDLWG